MSSWGATTTDEAKPKYLTDLEKEGAYATDAGWTVAPNVSDARKTAGADREVLVAIRGLGTAATKLAEASISSFRYITTTLSEASSDEMSVNVSWNERVTVTGTPKLVVSGAATGPIELDYASGTLTNNLVFTGDLTGGVNFAEADELEIGEDAIDLNGGTIKDTVSTNNAVKENTAAIGETAGKLVVAA
jgi:hypothetical protein